MPTVQNFHVRFLPAHHVDVPGRWASTQYDPMRWNRADSATLSATSPAGLLTAIARHAATLPDPAGRFENGNAYTWSVTPTHTTNKGRPRWPAGYAAAFKAEPGRSPRYSTVTVWAEARERFGITDPEPDPAAEAAAIADHFARLDAAAADLIALGVPPFQTLHTTGAGTRTNNGRRYATVSHKLADGSLSAVGVMAELYGSCSPQHNRGNNLAGYVGMVPAVTTWADVAADQFRRRLAHANTLDGTERDRARARAYDITHAHQLDAGNLSHEAEQQIAGRPLTRFEPSALAAVKLQLLDEERAAAVMAATAPFYADTEPARTLADIAADIDANEDDPDTYSTTENDALTEEFRAALDATEPPTAEEHATALTDIAEDLRGAYWAAVGDGAAEYTLAVIRDALDALDALTGRRTTEAHDADPTPPAVERPPVVVEHLTRRPPFAGLTPAEALDAVDPHGRSHAYH